MAAYIPTKGDFITLSFDPQSGHEQKGRRPALVISNFLFNQAMGHGADVVARFNQMGVAGYDNARAWSGRRHALLTRRMA